MPKMLSREEARRFYDRFGARQDDQGFYEDAALDALVRCARFEAATSVLEIGCGTGRFAARLLGDALSPTARYVAFDIAETMVALARERLSPWADRARVELHDGSPDYASFGEDFDRVVATYVFDLLSDADIRAALAAARAVTRTGGLLCTVGLTRGCGLLSSAASTLWRLVHRIRPSLVGGCRPLTLADHLPANDWRIVHRETVVASAIPSEVIVAEAA